VIDRVLGFHVSKCPVARTLEGCVEITTELELVTAQSANGRLKSSIVQRARFPRDREDK